MEKWIEKYFDELFAQGLAYRYTPERYQRILPLGGKPFASPVRAAIGCDGVEYVEEFIQLTVLPTSLGSAAYGNLKRLALAWREFFLAQETIVRESPELLEKTGTPAELKRGLEGMQTRNGHYDFPLPFVRLDMVRAGDTFKVVDINTTRPAGLGDWRIVNRVTDDCVPRAERLNCWHWMYYTTIEQSVERLETIWSRSQAKQAPGRRCIVTTADGDWHNFAELGRALNAKLSIAAGFEPQPDTTIIRGKIKEGDPGFDQLAGLYPDRACVLSPLFKRWCGNKLWFVLPQTEPYRQKFIQAMGPGWNPGWWFEYWRSTIPATGIVKSGWIEFPDNRIPPESLSWDTRWLLKTPSGSSAKGIRLSWWCGKKKWISTLYDCPNGIVQECDGDQETVIVLNEAGEAVEKKLYAKYGLFLLNGEIGGMEVMYSPRPIVHGGRDTYITAVRCPYSPVPQDDGGH